MRSLSEDWYPEVDFSSANRRIDAKLGFRF
jgi:hypothetical protein